MKTVPVDNNCSELNRNATVRILCLVDVISYTICKVSKLSSHVIKINNQVISDDGDSMMSTEQSYQDLGCSVAYGACKRRLHD